MCSLVGIAALSLKAFWSGSRTCILFTCWYSCNCHKSVIVVLRLCLKGKVFENILEECKMFEECNLHWVLSQFSCGFRNIFARRLLMNVFCSKLSCKTIHNNPVVQMISLVLLSNPRMLILHTNCCLLLLWWKEKHQDLLAKVSFLKNKRWKATVSYDLIFLFIEGIV